MYHFLHHGEVTGHAHRIRKGAKAYLLPDTDDTVSEAEIVEIEAALANLTHEEHDTIPLKKGFYRITIQREYSPQEIRRVLD